VTYSDANNYAFQQQTGTNGNVSITLPLADAEIVCCYVYVGGGATSLDHAITPARFDIWKTSS
jgi:hypothetical protein